MEMTGREAKGRGWDKRDWKKVPREEDLTEK